MDETTIKLIFTTLGWFVAKIEELPGRDIGEPDCLLIDPCIWSKDDHGHDHDHEGEDHTHENDRPFIVCRFPGKDTSPDTRIAISSSNIFTIMDPTPALVSEYLITISD